LGFETDKLKKQVGSLNNLVGYWKGKAAIKDTITTVLRDTVIIENDSVRVPVKWISWNNKYLFLDGAINGNNVSIAYNYNVDFSLTAYYKPRPFFQPTTWFKPKPLVADIYFSDPNLKVGEFKGLVIKQEKKRWYETSGFKFGVGFVSGVAFNKWASK
jgi:hypothetical protein